MILDHFLVTRDSDDYVFTCHESLGVTSKPADEQGPPQVATPIFKQE